MLKTIERNEFGAVGTYNGAAALPAICRNRREILRTLGGTLTGTAVLNLGTAIPASAQGGLLFASWIHGSIVQPEDPGASKVVRRGFGAECSRTPGTFDWFHFPIPTPVILQDVRSKVVKVFVLYKTSNARITNIHVWDAATNIIKINDLNFQGDHSGGVDSFNSWVLRPAVMRFGLVISAGVRFESADPDRPGISQVLFTSAGADFQRS